MRWVGDGSSNLSASESPGGLANTQTAGRHPEFLIQWVTDGPDKCISNRTPSDAYAAGLGYHIFKNHWLGGKRRGFGVGPQSAGLKFQHRPAVRHREDTDFL